jgi:hypothetical protein
MERIGVHILAVLEALVEEKDKIVGLELMEMALQIKGITEDFQVQALVLVAEELVQ